MCFPERNVCVAKKRMLRSTTPTLGFFLLWRCDPTWVMASSLLRFLDHTRRRSTVGRTPLDEWSARRRDLYLTTHNTHNRQTSMPAVGFEPTVSAGERPQTHALDRTATGTGYWPLWRSEILCEIFSYSSASKAAHCLNRPSTLRGTFIQSVVEMNAFIFLYIIV